MTRRRAPLACFWPVLCVWALQAACEEPRQAVEPLRPEEVAGLIRDLGDDDYFVREKATKRLKEAGEEAVDAVCVARDSKDAEVAIRAQEVYDTIGKNVIAQTRTGDFFVVGPFQFRQKEGESGIDLATPVETDVKAGDLAKKHEWTCLDGSKQTLPWQRPCKGQTGMIDFIKVFGRQIDWANAYALTYVKAEKACEAKLLIGSDDSIIVWVNGERVHRNDIQRALAPDQDSVPVKFAPGWNPILIKIQQGIGSWSLSLRVTDAEGKRWPRACVDPAQGKEEKAEPAK